MWGIALLLSCLFSLYFRTADEHGVVWLGLGKILPLHRSSVIQETLNPRAANQGRLLWLFYENLQQTPKTFFFQPFSSPQQKKKKDISRRVFSAVSFTLSVFLDKCPQPFNPLPAPTSYQPTMVFLSKILRALVCRDRVPVCMSQIKRGSYWCTCH